MNSIARRSRIAALAHAVLLAGVSGLLGSCKVMTLDEDRALRARRATGFDAAAYVDRIWSTRVVPELQRRAVPAATLLPAATVDLDRAGASHGRRTGEGAAWTFVLDATGRVTSVDTASRQRIAEVELAGPSSPRSVRVQIGPVVSGTAVRDALPFVTFNDFADQLAFADVGRALTRRALAGVAPALKVLKPGQRVRILAVTNIAGGDEPPLVTPVAIALLDAEALAR